MENSKTQPKMNSQLEEMFNLTEQLAQRVVENRDKISKINSFPPKESENKYPTPVGNELNREESFSTGIYQPTTCDQLDTVISRLHEMLNVLSETNTHLNQTVN